MISEPHENDPTCSAPGGGEVTRRPGQLPRITTRARLQCVGQPETGIPTDDYLSLLDERTAELLTHGTPATYPVSLAAGYQIAFDRLAADAPAVLDLLTLAADGEVDPRPRLTTPIEFVAILSEQLHPGVCEQDEVSMQVVGIAI